MGGHGRLVAGMLLLLALPAPAEEGAPALDEPRATMHRVFDALAVLLPASLDEDTFHDPAHRDALQLSFEALVAATNRLSDHGALRHAAFGALSRTLAQDADEAASLFARGRMEEAAFSVQHLTQRCVTCHSRLPSARKFPLGERLLEKVPSDELDPGERALLLVATRQFDASLAAWEGHFEDPSVAPVQLDQSGELADYLTIAIRVERDLPRAERTLLALDARDDGARYLHDRLALWSATLATLAESPPSPTLVRARELMAQSARLTQFPGASDGLVHDLAASAVLEQYVHAKRGVEPPDLELAEAFYRLAIIEERTSWSWWTPQSDAYLEAALRSAPLGPYAPPAYRRIEEILLADHGAARDAELPEHERTRLQALQKMMEKP
jgi:hypothetical protein